MNPLVNNRIRKPALGAPPRAQQSFLFTLNARTVQCKHTFGEEYMTYALQ